MTDTLPTGEEPEDELDPEALAAELDLGIDLSPEEREAADQMVAHLQAQFGEQAVEEEPAEEPEVEEEEPEEAPTEAPPVVATSAAPSTPGVVIDGVTVPVEEAVAYLTKREAQRQAAEQAPAPPPPPPIPDWVDQDDPADVARWQYMAKLEAQQAALLANQKAVAEAQTSTRAQADANAGISTFRTLHPELSEDDITVLRRHAASLEIIDGLARTRNGSDAVAKALDIAYWDHPEFRARATAEPSPAAVKKAERAEKKAKLNALGGSSGSVPRTETRTRPNSDREMKDQAVEYLKGLNILQ